MGKQIDEPVGYLSSGRLENALDDLRMSNQVIGTSTSNYLWKWLSITLTRALYAVGLHIIYHKDPARGVYRKRLEKLERRLSNGELTSEQFWDEIDKQQLNKTVDYDSVVDWIKANIHIKCSTAPMTVDPATEEEVIAAKSARHMYRDQFEHMKFDGHSFQVSQLPNKFLLVTSLLSKAIESDWFFMCASSIREELIVELKPITSFLEEKSGS